MVNIMERSEIKIIKLMKRFIGDYKIERKYGIDFLHIIPDYRVLNCVCKDCNDGKAYNYSLSPHIPFNDERGYGDRTLDEALISSFYHTYLIHIKNQIRLNGSISHMKLLLSLFGKIKTKKILEEYCKKNSLANNRIKLFLNKL